MPDIQQVLEQHAPPAAVALVAHGDDVEVTTLGDASRDSISASPR